MYEIRISDGRLNKFRVLKGTTLQDAQIKAVMQKKAWDKQWQRAEQMRVRRQKRENAARNKEARKLLAADKTKEAEALIAELENLLRDATGRDHRIDWENLKDRSDYPVPKPDKPNPTSTPPEPLSTQFTPKMNLLIRSITPLREKRLAEGQQQFDVAHSTWEAKKAEIEKLNEKQAEEYETHLAGWEAKRAAWIKDQQDRNTAIDDKRAAYLSRTAQAVADYCEMVLSGSEYPESFPSGFELEYAGDTRTLVLDYSLPPTEVLPNTKSYKYVATRDEIKSLPVSDSWLNKTYDSALYQVALRTLYELFQSDDAKALDAIVLNGWVNSVDKATGKQVNSCILTIQASKQEFLEINLPQVDPKACFKKLKGISAAKLRSLSPVRPILQLNRDDKRFVQPYGVVDALDGSANLAAMDWEDFEHLIREVFQKEFSGDGGEVKITRASRDHGVDAVAFDPDPIRGGKIVIQAKRYTNTVSVSAVRDLYGTILNEGANKGILVTTADYGPEAYEFAKGKPITLLNGSELLYLLEKHGHKARIDLAEARMLAAE